MWGTVLGCFLGAAVALSNAHVSPQPRPYAAFCALFVHGAVFCLFTGVVGAIEIKRMSELDARRKVERAARIASAPSRENLPSVTRQPFDRVLLLESFGPCRPDTPTRPVVDGRRGRSGKSPVTCPPPGHEPYEVIYWCLDPKRRSDFIGDLFAGDRQRDRISQPPTWAAYELDERPASGRAHDPSPDSARHVYQDGQALTWSSGNKLLFMHRRDRVRCAHRRSRQGLSRQVPQFFVAGRDPSGPGRRPSSMSRLRIVPLDDAVIFPGMTVTLPLDDAGSDSRVLLVPRQGSGFARVGVVAEVVEPGPAGRPQRGDFAGRAASRRSRRGGGRPRRRAPRRGRRTARRGARRLI